MLNALWSDDRWRALAAGLVYAVLAALASHLRWRFAARAGGRPAPGLAADLVGLAGSLAYPMAMVLLGGFSPTHVGLVGVDWRGLWPALGAGALAGCAWTLLTWGARGPTRSMRGDRVPRASHLTTLAGMLPSALQHEAWLAAGRAALSPVIGSHWGTWAAPVLRVVVSNTSPIHQHALHSSPGRRRAYLEMALDWVSSAVFAITGALWPALAVRAVCLLASLAAGAVPATGAPAGRHLPARTMTTLQEPVGDAPFSE